MLAPNNTKDSEEYARQLREATQAKVSEEEVRQVLQAIHQWNFCNPKLWLDQSNLGVASFMYQFQLDHVLGILREHGWIEMKEDDVTKFRLTPRGLLEVNRLKGVDQSKSDIVDQVRTWGRQNPWIAWPIIGIVSATVLLAFFNQVIQALKNLGLMK